MCLLWRVFLAALLVSDSIAADLFQNIALFKNLIKRNVKTIDYSSIKTPQCKDDVKYWLDSVDIFLDALSMNCSESDTVCTENQTEITNQNIFAAKQIDSFGRIPANLLGMNTLWMGSWEECVAVSSQVRPSYEAQFCYVSIAFSVPMSTPFLEGFKAPKDACDSPLLPRWSVCVPKSCTEQDITAVMRNVSNSTSSIFTFCKTECRPTNPPEPDTVFWIVMGYCFLGLALVVVSSIFDYCTESEEYSIYRQSTGAQCLLAFSMYTNGSQIMDITKRPGQIHCLNCIRTFTMTWVMAGHITALYLEGDNPLSTLESTVYILNDVFVTVYFSVDTFFFISGLLLGFVFYREMNKNPKRIKSAVSWILYYVHRYLRLSPPYFLFIGLTVALFNHVTVGPVLLHEVHDIKPCKTKWWRNVLYINKMYDNEGMCIPHTWYLAADMQMYIFAPLFLVPLFYSPTLGYSIAFILIVLTAGINYGVYFKHDFPANYVGYFADIFDVTKRFNYDQLVYYAVWLRFTPYLVGILTGYFLYRTRGKKLHLHWVFVLLLWIASTAVALSCIYGLYDYFQGPAHKISTFASASYSYWSRLGWAMSIAWVVIACQNNWAGPIKNFMELGFWAPLGRLTYCAFLTHGLVMPMIFSMDRQALHYVSTQHSYIREAVPLFVVSYATAFLWSCMFEVPFGKLESMMIRALVGNRLEPKPTLEDPKAQAKQNYVGKEGTAACNGTNFATSNGNLMISQSSEKVICRF